MKIKTDLYNSIISVFSIMLIILGVVPNLVLALDGQLGDGTDSTNDTPHSDLIIEKFYTDPTAPTPGSNVIVYASVKNVGNLASNPVYLNLSIGDVSSLYYSDSISPEAEVTFSQAWTAPNSEGIVILKASIDGIDNSQKEIDLLVENPRPDLIIQNIVSDPAVPQAGQALNFTFTVVNQGTAPSVEALATYYTTNMISGQDISIPSLVVGASANLSFSLTPDQVKEGQMEVKVVADSGNTLLERNESNNVLTKTLKVKGLPPDLVVEAISLNPATPKVGDNISFIATIKNIGSGTSPASKLKYFINGAGDANNVMLNGSLPVPALAIGEAKQCTFYWVPTGEGSIVVTALVDPDSVISETDETNNRNTLTATITMESTSNDGGGDNSGSSSDSSSDSSSSSSSSSGSSSGSGSSIGSSFSKEPAKNVASKELATRYVMSDTHVRFEFPQGSTCVQYIEFDAKRTFLKTTTTIEELKGKSTFVSDRPSGGIYKYFNTWVGEKSAGNSSSLSNGLIGFRVEKSWFKNNSINPSLITLQRYNKKWEPLYTEKVEEDNDYIYFKSKTPEFTFFAITYKAETNGNGTQIDSNMPKIGSLAGTGNKNIGSSGKKYNPKDVRDASKKLMAIALPGFLILVGYLMIKKRI